MKNIRSTVLASLAALCVLATSSLAAAPPKSPVFVDCPEQYRGCAGDSIFLQVKAVHPNSGKSSGVRYFMVDGPGSVDPVTGIWSYATDDTGRTSRWPLAVEIGASIGNSPHETFAEQNCRFEVSLGQTRPPRFKFADQTDTAVFAVQYGTPLEIPVWVYDPYDCGVEISIVGVYPEFAGTYELKGDTILVINVAQSDMEKQFQFTLKGESHGLVGYGSVIVDTRTVIPTPEFVSCPEGPIVVQPCAMASAMIMAVLPPYNDSIGIEYEIVSGPGKIDAQGYWYYNWDENEAGQTFEVEISASYLGQSTSPDDNCKFTVEIAESVPIDFSQFEQNPCGDTLEAFIGLPGSVNIRVAENADCSPVQFFVESVTPPSAANVWCDTLSYGGAGNVYYSFGPQAAGIIYAVKVGAYQLTDTIFCEFYIAVEGDDPAPPFAVRIENQNHAIQGEMQDVAIMLDQAPVDMGGFQFLISYNSSALSFQTATLGETLGENGCDWEYFTYRIPSAGRLLLLSIANVNDPSNPVCYRPQILPAALLNIKFLVTSDRTFECEFSPINFIWDECYDNAISSLSGDTLFVSQSVYNASGSDITDESTGYPTLTGGQNDDCFRETFRAPVRAVNFYDGGVRMKCDSVDPSHGDVNLNGIAYEIADVFLFGKYLIYGDSVLIKDVAAQLANTDVNIDGVTGTIEDYAYFLNIVNGTALPGPLTPSPDTAILSTKARSELAVKFDSEDELGAILVVIAGSVTPVLEAPNVEMAYHFNGSETRILIGTMDLTPINSGLLLSNLGANQILEVTAATTTGHKVYTSFLFIDPFTLRVVSPIPGTPLGSVQDVDIVLDNVPIELGGFDLLLKYDPAILTVQQVTLGEQFGANGCDWEYFTYHTTEPGMLKIVALAETNDGDNHPACFTPPGPSMLLATMTFQISGDSAYNCGSGLIQFVWTDCSDNALTTNSGDPLYISNRVFNYGFGELTDPNVGTYPTIRGAQDIDCFESPEHRPVRMIDFYDGAIIFSCRDTIDYLGDVNLNAIAYEIADYVIFSSYMIFGNDAFTIDFDKQLAATDVNTDGTTGQIEDLTYLGAIIRGDLVPKAGPFPPSNDTLFLNRPNPSDLVVAFNSSDQIGAIALVIADSVELSLVQTDVQMGYDYNGLATTVLISSWPNDELVTNGLLLSGLDGHDILVAVAATTDGKRIPVSFDHTLPVGPTKIRIEKVEMAFLGQTYDIPISLDQIDFDLGGFDFLIGYPSEMLSFQHVEFGDAFDENGCGWEYFTYRIESPGLLKLVGLAETNNGPIHPSCWTPNSLPTPFATLNFLVSNDPIYECLFAPVTFFWTDCSDNSLADKSGNDLYISSAVFDIFGNDIADPTTGTYPTNLGSQDVDCFNNPTHLPIRNIEFRNGGIDIVCVEPIDVIGDVNLNGITYEIADFVLFSNYLIYGPQAFKVDLEGQLAATDINTDSVKAQIEDLTYLGAIVRGDMLPLKGPFPQSFDTLILDSPNPSDINVVFKSNTDQIGAILMVVADSVRPFPSQSQVDMGYDYDGTNTTILISSWEGNTVAEGLLLSGMAGHEILQASAATVDGKKIVTYVTGNEGLAPAANLALPTAYTVHQNYPNPFNPSTTIRFDLPKAAAVHFQVINILGATVYDFNRNYEAGSQEVVWDGTDNGGRQVASGVYYYRINAGDFSQTRKMILLK